MSDILPIDLGPFRVVDLLGRGGMGLVYRATHRKQGLLVALKVITAGLADSGGYQLRFRREVQLMAGLDHPGIVALLDYGEITPAAAEASTAELQPGSPWYAMEYVHGGSLGQAHVTSWASLRDALTQILDALGHAHARGLVHRDLKPQNILVASEADQPLRLLLTDFGISHPTEDPDLKSTSQIDALVAGTPAYMAPEQYEGRWRDQGAWTDLYALGCLAYWLACGRLPFPGPELLSYCHQHLTLPPPPLTPRFPVADGFQDWIHRLLQKPPLSRFVRAADARWDLDALPDVAPDHVAPPADGAVVVLDGPMNTVIGDLALSATVTIAESPVLHAAARAAPVPTTSVPADVPPMPDAWLPPTVSAAPPRMVDVGMGLFGFRDVPLVGRGEACDQVWRALAEVRKGGMTRCVIVRGEAGMGKSRLVEWMGRRAHELGAASLWRCAYAPFAGPAHGLGAMVSRVLRCGGLDRAKTHRRVEAEILQRGVPSVSAVHLAAGLTELVLLGGAQVDPHSAPAVRFASVAEQFTALRRALEVYGRLRPVIVAIDDVQWGADAIAFARFLLAARDDAPVPVLLLLTVDPEALTDRPLEQQQLLALAGRPDVETLDLPPLPPADQVELVTRLLPLHPELARSLVDRTDGNPLWAVELLGDCVRRGLLESTAEGFRAPGDLLGQLPDTLHTLWTRRLEHALAGLDTHAAINALQVAAALGDPVVWAEWLSVCVAAGTRPPAGFLDVLASHNLIAIATEDQQWRFSHSLLRESLIRAARERGRWRALHRICADALALRYPSGTPGLAERRALHLLEAEALDLAIDPLHVAIGESINTARYDKAQQLLDRYDRLLDELQLAEDDPRRGRSGPRRARIFANQGHPDQARLAAQQALDRATTHHWESVQASARTELGLCARASGELAEAREHLEDAVAIFKRRDERSELARVLLELARVDADQGLRAEATARLLVARKLCEELGDELQAAYCLWFGAELLLAADHHEDARRYARTALAVFEKRGDRNGQCYALNMLAEIDRISGKLDDAALGYRSAMVLAEQIGQLHGVRFLRFNLGLTSLQLRDFDAAHDLFVQVLPFFVKHHLQAVVVSLHAALLACAAARGDLDAVDAHFEVVSDILSRAPGIDLDLATSTELAGELLLEAGDAERAERAWCVALGQWDGLANHARRADLERRLAQLDG